MKDFYKKRLRTQWDFFFWDEIFETDEKLSLRDCLFRYGVGGQYCKSKDMVVIVLYLCENRTPDNSWLLGVKHFYGDQEQGESTLYDGQRFTYRMSTETHLGKEILALLSDEKACVFQQE